MAKKKYPTWILPIAALFGYSSGASCSGELSSPQIVVQQVTPEDSEVLEEWSLVETNPDILGVGVVRISDGEWAWQVSVDAMEFVRQDPLESKLSAAISLALSEVEGVTMAHHEDREVWAINGDPDGATLVYAVAYALGPFSDMIQEELSNLESGG